MFHTKKEGKIEWVSTVFLSSTLKKYKDILLLKWMDWLDNLETGKRIICCCTYLLLRPAGYG